jgi:hypothetical protein
MEKSTDTETLPIEGKSTPANAMDLVMQHVTDVDGVFRVTETRLDGKLWQHLLYPLTVISSVSQESDGKRWLHVSFAHQKRMPNYEEITSVKARFIGKDKYAMMVFPPEDKYVNLHQYCLHLWHCLDGHPLPEFSGYDLKGRRTI